MVYVKRCQSEHATQMDGDAALADRYDMWALMLECEDSSFVSVGGVTYFSHPFDMSIARAGATR